MFILLDRLLLVLLEVGAIRHHEATVREFFRASSLDMTADHVAQLQLGLFDPIKTEFDLALLMEVLSPDQVAHLNSLMGM